MWCITLQISNINALSYFEPCVTSLAMQHTWCYFHTYVKTTKICMAWHVQRCMLLIKVYHLRRVEFGVGMKQLSVIVQYFLLCILKVGLWVLFHLRIHALHRLWVPQAASMANADKIYHPEHWNAGQTLGDPHWWSQLMSWNMDTKLLCIPLIERKNIS